MHRDSRLDDPSQAPRTWALLGDKSGDTAQLRILGRALGWPVEEKPLRFTRLFRAPNLLLGATRASLDPGSRPHLAPPWPDLVLASGRRTAPVALWIKKQSRGRSRIVVLGRPRAPLGWFDLVVAAPQYGLPSAPNVLHIDLPLNAIPPERLRRAAAAWLPRLDLPPPYLALVVGGTTTSIRFDAADAAAVGDAVSARAAATGMSVLATTSPRTPQDAVAALSSHLTGPRVLHRWTRDGDNPYAAFLGLADRIVVTGDSASMLAEAIRTGKPVEIVPPRQIDTANPLARRLRSTIAEPTLRRLGLYNGPPNIHHFIQRLVDRGLATIFGTPAPRRRGAIDDDLARITSTIEGLLDGTVERPHGGDRQQAAQLRFSTMDQARYAKS